MTATLQPKKGGDAFCVGTYTPACSLVDKYAVMVIHATLAASRVKKVKSALCNFNVKPYAVTGWTQGSLSGEFADRTPTRDGDSVAMNFASRWSLSSRPLGLANGKNQIFNLRIQSSWVVTGRSSRR